MYCKKCGKQLDYDGDICPECKDAETFFGTPETAATQNPTEQAPVNSAAPSYPPYPPYQQPYAQPAQQPVQAQPAQYAPVQNNDKKFGLGKAVASLVMGVIAWFLLEFTLEFIGGFITELSSGYYSTEQIQAAIPTGLGITLVLFLIGLGLAIPSLVLAIQSIRCYSRRKREGYAKPTATLVLGILGVVASSFALFYSLLTLFMMMSLSLLV